MEVLTLTGNLLAEWTFDVVRMQPGKTHRAEHMTFQVGGKGVNVARVLQHLGIATEAYGFASGSMAEHCTQWLHETGIAHRWYPLEKGVRPGLVIRETGNADSKETTFLGLDLAVPSISWECAIKDAAEQNPGWLAICGSIPGWQSGWVEPVHEHLLAKGIQVCADTYGPPLQDLIRLPIELVKVNRLELAGLVPEMAEASSIDLLAQVSQNSPVRNWIITDGAGAVLAAFENGEIYELRPAIVEEVSATGSGDTFLAALLQQSLMGAGAEELLSHAAACASANAAAPGIADFPLDSVQQYRPEITRLG